MSKQPYDLLISSLQDRLGISLEAKIRLISASKGVEGEVTYTFGVNRIPDKAEVDKAVRTAIQTFNKQTGATDGRLVHLGDCGFARMPKDEWQLDPEPETVAAPSVTMLDAAHAAKKLLPLLNSITSEERTHHRTRLSRGAAEGAGLMTDTDTLTVAVETLRAVEETNEQVQGFTFSKQGGVQRHVVRDMAHPGGKVLWEKEAPEHEYEAVHDELMTEIEAIKDARRITAVAKVIARAERVRVWELVASVVNGVRIPPPETIPPEVERTFAEYTRAECVTAGATQALGQVVGVLKRAAQDDFQGHVEPANDADAPRGGNP